jgi:hypothetical protein
LYLPERTFSGRQTAPQEAPFALLVPVEDLATRLFLAQVLAIKSWVETYSETL